MKIKLFLSLLLLLCLLLTSCSSNHDENVIFIHGASFYKNENDSYDVYFICENLESEGRENKYFCLSLNKDNFNKSIFGLEKSGKKYYFATCEIYFFDEELPNESLYEIALSLCQSNKFPLSATSLLVKNWNKEIFSNNIRNEKNFKEILDFSKTESESICDFFKEISVDGEKKCAKISFSQNGMLLPKTVKNNI